MSDRQIGRVNQQSKGDTPLVSGILQRAAVRSIADQEVQGSQEVESGKFSESRFQHNFSQLPIHSRGLPIQAKLTIGAVGDRYEQEADRVAKDVVEKIHTPATAQSTQGQSVQSQEEADEELQAKPSISELQRSPLSPELQREAMPEEEELQAKSTLQRREGIAEGEASTDLESAINSARGSGQPLEAGLQQSLGQAMGVDFSGVKVHTDAQADQLNRSIQAKAFTTGQDVFFRQGAYQSGSRGGQELIAHELTHVVQQTDGQGQRSPLTPQQFQKHSATETPSASVDDRLIQAKGSMKETDKVSALAQRPNHTGLPEDIKSGIESLSGISMENVKVHYNSSQPAQLNALAYAQGSKIYVAPGQEQHLPHEAWHFVQQAQGRVKPTMQMKDGVLVNDDEGLEQEADVMGARVVHMKRGIYDSRPDLVCPSLNFLSNYRMTNSVSTDAAPTVQRYLDPSIMEDIATDPELKAALNDFITNYNEDDVQPSEVYSRQKEVSLEVLLTQINRLDDIENYINKNYINLKESQTKPDNFTALEALKKNIAADRAYVKEQYEVLSFWKQHSLSLERMFLLFQEPVHRKIVTDALAAAEKSPVIMKLLIMLLKKTEISPTVIVKVLPLILEKIELRKYMVQLHEENALFKSENLEHFAENYENLTDWYKFLIKTRNLPEDFSPALFDKKVDNLFQGKMNYQQAAATLAIELPKPVTILEIASELTEGMQTLGYEVFLAGGGAIFFRGGKRPIADLDFRMDAQPGLTSFSSFHGKQVLKMVNRLLEISKNAREAGLTFSHFSAAGKKAITIGTHNWFKVEVSISINQGFPHENLESKDLRFHSDDYVKHVAPKAKPTKTLHLLSLTDLLRDKLKTAITRTKEGEVNYKKVAQDLFDILTVINLLRAQGLNVLNSKDLESHLKERVDQYKVQNLEPPEVNITEFPVMNIVKLMLYRLVKTAQYHLEEGPRRNVFLNLQSHSSMEVLTILEELASIPVGDLLVEFGEFNIEEWFKIWNKKGASPKEHMKIPAPNPLLVSLSQSPVVPGLFEGNALVAHILETAPPELLKAEDHIRILYILYKSKDSLRFLDNSNNPIEVMAAFSDTISVRGFKKFYQDYSNKKYVQGEKKGLKLLPEGFNYIKMKLSIFEYFY